MILVVSTGRLRTGAQRSYLSFLSITFAQTPSLERRQVSERLNTRQKEVSAPSNRGESWQTLDFLPNRSLWDGHVKTPVSEFQKSDRARFPAHESLDRSPTHSWQIQIDGRGSHIPRTRQCLVLSRRRGHLLQRWTRTPSPDHLPPIHVHSGITRVHAPRRAPSGQP